MLQAVEIRADGGTPRLSPRWQAPSFASDGAILQRQALAGPGQRFAPPLITEDAVYVPSCGHTGTPVFNEGPSRVEAFSIVTPED